MNIEEKANYCLNCKNSLCSIKGCPLGNNIPNFINKIREKKYEEAFRILEKTTVLPSICGRICPHMKQCQGSCIRGIKGEPVSIGELEAFIGDMAIEKGWKFIKPENELDKKIAVVGGGPSGLTAAAFMRKMGYQVTIYEKHSELGGILNHGIPEFRLNKNIVNKTINNILDLGINVKYNMELGVNFDLETLKSNYDLIILCFGANLSVKMNIEGENLEGVLGGNELLECKNFPDFKDKIVAVNGGGNTAMDVARTIIRKGAKKVYVVYRRSRQQMPAEQKEIDDAIKEGVEFLFQNNILKISGQNKVEKIECIKTELVRKEGENRLVPVNIVGSNYNIPVDYVIMAIGGRPDEDLLKKLKLKLTNKGYIEKNDIYQTSDELVYCIGDISGEINTVAWAAKSGRDLAKLLKNDIIKK